MSLPGGVLSSQPVPSDFSGAGKSDILLRTVDHEDGPIAEQDVSKGLVYQKWTAWVGGDGNIWVGAGEVAPRVLISALGTITDVSIAFNQNGDLHCAYVEDGQAKLYWYDPTIPGFTTTNLPEGSRTPKITMDEKRIGQQLVSDIILCYIKADNGLYYRQQRERFQIERLLHPGPFVMIRQMYMNTGWRLQWLLVPGVPIL